jgi:hypothetical protein
MSVRFLSGINVDSNTLFVDSTNNRVGIGTASPSVSLDVQGSINIKSTFNLTWGGAYGAGTPTITGNVISSFLAFYPSGSTSGETMRITSGGNVGIGTTSPSYLLHVSGSSYFDGNMGINGEGSGVTVDTGYGNNGRVGFMKYGGLEGMLVAGSDTVLRLGHRTDSTVVAGGTATIRQDLVITAAGNVGIGTASPQAINASWTTLEVQGRSSGGGGIVYTANNGATVKSHFYSDGTSGFVGTQTNHIFGFTTNNNEVARFTTGGNLLIGTTTDGGYKLNVNGNTQSNGIIIGTDLTYGGTYRSVSFGANQNGSNRIFATTDAADGMYFASATGTGFTFRPNGGTADLVKITSTGNVGIGADSPGTKLHVLGGNTDTVGQIRVGGNAVEYVSGIDFYTATSSRGFIGWRGVNSGAPYNAYGMYLLNYDNSPIIFGTATGNEKMRINDNGNVGINSTNPGAKLEVISANLGGTAGDQTLQALFSTSNGNGSYLEFKDVRTSTGADWTYAAKRIQMRIDSTYMGYVQFNGTGNDAGISFGTGATTTAPGNVAEKMRITSAGNVGIGNTTPGAVLTVGTQSSGTAGFGVAQDNSIVGRFGAANTAGRVTALTIANTATPTVGNDATLSFIVGGNYSATGLISSILQNTSTARTDMAFSVYNVDGNYERMRITGGGNVGIGTTSPGSKLNIVDGFIRVQGTEVDQFFLEGLRTGTSTTVRIYDNSSVAFYDSYSSTIFRANQLGGSGGYIGLFGGNVGVNEGAPSQRLHITGNIRVTGAYYDSNNEAGTSGQVLSSTGSGTDWVSLSEITGVDGTGTANYVAKWSDTDTITNSQIVDNGTNVGINNASPKTKLDVNGAIGFGSKSMSMTDTFATALTVNMNDHNGCYVKITAFGDWGNHSTIAYLGEFFLQASAGAYNEPGIIIRQVDNTGGGDDIQAQIVDPAGTGTRDFVIQLKATSSANTPFTAVLQYEVRGQYNSVS